MEERFRRRRIELEAECQVPANLFSQTFDRLEAFLVPYLVNFRRREQRGHALQAIQGLCSLLRQRTTAEAATLESGSLAARAIERKMGSDRCR